VEGDKPSKAVSARREPGALVAGLACVVGPLVGLTDAQEAGGDRKACSGRGSSGY
jgi:hypothetical protein